jgi:hypothetical protein
MTRGPAAQVVIGEQYSHERILPLTWLIQNQSGVSLTLPEKARGYVARVTLLSVRAHPDHANKPVPQKCHLGWSQGQQVARNASPSQVLVNSRLEQLMSIRYALLRVEMDGEIELVRQALLEPL